MITVAALACVGAVLLLLVWLTMFRHFETSAAAMMAWVLCFALCGIGILLIAFRGIVPLPISIAGGNVCLFLGLGFYGFALSKTLSGRARLFPVLFAPAIWLGLCFVPVVYGHYSTRAASANLIVAAIIFQIAYAGIFSNRNRLFIPYFITAIAILYGVTHIVFSLMIYSANISTIQEALSHPVFATFYFVSTLMFCIVLMLSFGLIFEVELHHFRQRAQTDDLTGLLSRKAFFKQATASKTNQNVLVMIDIDHFKSINDTHGHIFGDAVLAVFGDTCRKVLPPQAVASRLGGEEFALYLSDTQPKQANALLDRIRAGFNRETSGMTKSGSPVTFSAGVFSYEGNTFPVEQALIAADKLLYAAKQDGRDRIRSHDTGAAGPARQSDAGQELAHA
ncbi:GGDEF domain-containing protein [Roseibium sp. SCPC15]|uniref:GGDEF domain-containing protein n=1 Tax=Roseibium sp. SCP15 TaxID=3141376 RepID=UPI003337BEAC